MTIELSTQYLIYIALFITTTSSHKVVESTEDIYPAGNITTLYPVTKNHTASSTKLKSATSWKIETTFGESKLDSNNTSSKEELVVERPENSSQEFRPSQHLGGFVDEDSFPVVPTKETSDAFRPVIKKPPTGFISSPKENYKSQVIKFPKEILKNYQEFPYKYEPAILTRAKNRWNPTSTPGVSSTGATSLETRPTAEVPVSVPAGGFYKYPDPFKDKPGNGDDDFGLEFSGHVKEQGVKKRVSPWKNLIQLLTALIPVGIIFSALTPNLITIEHDQLPPFGQGPGNIFRRSDGTIAQLPVISERCRRRLLCELHSDSNYSSTPSRRKQCHRIRCENPDALAHTLQWLLSHKRPNDGRTGDHYT